MIGEALFLELIQSTGLTNALLILYGLYILEVKQNLKRLFDKKEDAEYVEIVPIGISEALEKKHKSKGVKT